MEDDLFGAIGIGGALGGGGGPGPGGGAFGIGGGIPMPPPPPPMGAFGVGGAAGANPFFGAPPGFAGAAFGPGGVDPGGFNFWGGLNQGAAARTNYGAFSNFSGSSTNPFGTTPSWTARPGGGGGYGAAGGFMNPMGGMGGGGHMGGGGGAGYHPQQASGFAGMYGAKGAAQSGFDSPIFKEYMAKYEAAQKEAKDANQKRYDEILGGYKDLYDTSMGGYGDLLSDVQGGYGRLLEDTLAGYGQRRDTAMGLLDNMSNQSAEDITALYGRERSKSAQNLVDRGLGNTTVVESMNRGLTNAESAEQRRLADQVLQQRVGLELQTQGDTLAARERLTGGQLASQERLMAAELEAQERLRTNQFGFQERREDTYPDMGMYAQLAQMAAAGGGASGGAAGGHYGGGGSYGGGFSGPALGGMRPDGMVSYGNGGAVGTNVANMIRAGAPTMQPIARRQQMRNDIANFGAGYNPLSAPRR